jgi:hypothetical protein
MNIGPGPTVHGELPLDRQNQGLMLTNYRYAHEGHYLRGLQPLPSRTWPASPAVEGELGLDVGTLQKCVSVLWRDIEWDDDAVSGHVSSIPVITSDSPSPFWYPRDAEISARVYSLATPKYIDVHVKYHCRSGVYDVEWDYSLGYKIHHHISEPPTAYRNPSTKDNPSDWHTRGG